MDLSPIKAAFAAYRADKEELSCRIIENDRWYRQKHALHKGESDGDMITPCTGYLFNVLANKHADAMDNYPEPNITEREPHDRETARLLSAIVPAELSLCRFRRTYSKAWWYKLKNGAAAYGVFYDPAKDGIVISQIDLLNLYWKNGVTDIQDSPYLFITRLYDRAELAREYPDADVRATGPLFGVHTYDGYTPDEDTVLVIDAYYKIGSSVHLCKYAGDTVLYSSEDAGLPTLYDHGMYPVVLDVMYPLPNSPVGFGMIDVVKNPQTYIDRLDYAICRNALIAGRPRWIIRDNGGINENELLDLENDVIHVAGSSGEENIRQLQARQLSGFIMEHRHEKIMEMKEIAGNRDFQAGGTSGNVTAASAILALQNSGEKLGRDMIGESYNAFCDIVYLMISLIRQFYTSERTYRVAGEYVTWPGGFGEGGEPAFDVSVTAERNSPYARETGNQMALSLWQMGVFEKGREAEALAMIDLMNFDGKERLKAFLERREAYADSRSDRAL